MNKEESEQEALRVVGEYAPSLSDESKKDLIFIIRDLILKDLAENNPPVAWMCHSGEIWNTPVSPYKDGRGQPLYAHPQPAPDFERGKQDGWEACESCHGIVNGKLRFHSAPEGWQLVPKEATEEMIKAIRYASSFTSGYRAMLAAAPEYKEDK